MTTPQNSQKQIQVQSLLAELIELIENAKVVPFSSSVLIPQDEVLYLLAQISNTLPNELEQAQEVLKYRKEFLDGMRTEGAQIIEDARARAELMVQRNEIARQANIIANRERESARQEAKKLRYETAHYCHEKIKSLDRTIDELSHIVKGSKEKIQKEFLEELAPDQVPNIEDYTNLDETLDPDSSLDIYLFDQDSI